MVIDYLKEAEFLLRILLAALCGGVVGYERKNRGKGAGIRTHIIVAVAACLITIVAQYGFADFFRYMKGQGLEVSLDPSRIAAQIVSGVGFLGAGMIFVQKKVVTGLTTAAGIWAVSGIGMAIGGGMYCLGVSCSVIIVIIQIIFHKNWRILHMSNDEPITIVADDSENVVENIVEAFSSEGVPASVTGFSRDGGRIEISLTANVHQGFDLSPVISKLRKNDEIQSVKV